MRQTFSRENSLAFNVFFSCIERRALTDPIDKNPQRVAIIGTAGVPAQYGGFETLADQLVRYVATKSMGLKFVVYCSGKPALDDDDYYGASLRFLPISANGIASIIYDAISCVDAWMRGVGTLLILGVSGAPILFFLRLISSVKIVTNVDGVEWKRQKWGFFARQYLRFAEWSAVKASHVVIADNEGIREYLSQTYGINAHVITYGGDHSLTGEARSCLDYLPDEYALALCRIEPENNVHLILQGFVSVPDIPLVFVGNWSASQYGAMLKEQYKDHAGIFLLDPIYDENTLFTLRSRASFYVHGHSAGGTNPSLVEMMHFELPIIAYDCVYNRHTTENSAYYFSSEAELSNVMGSFLTNEKMASRDDALSSVQKVLEIAQQKYIWEVVGNQYVELLKATKD